MWSLFQDVRYGTRMLKKSPATTLVAVLTLALGIGANTTIFSAVNGLLLRPLPVAHADRLVILGYQQGGETFTHVSYSDFQDIRSHADAFSDIFCHELSLAGLENEGKTEPVILSYVSGNYFQALGLNPELGRLFQGAETEKMGTEQVVVLGHAYWKKRFNGDANVIGRQVKLNGYPFTVVGITPESFHGTYSLVDMQAYIPLGLETLWQQSADKTEFFTRRNRHDVTILGVPKPGLDRKQAETALNVLAQQLAQQYPDAHQGWNFKLYPERLARPEPDPTNGLMIVGVVFMLLAGLVLLLACSNVANIVLVRATAREREMAIRTALGAARRRLVAQLMTESILLALMGGVAGLLAGIWATRLITSIRIEVATIPLLFDFSFDWRVFIFALLAALATGILVGLAPAWRAARANFNQVLHEGSRGVLGSGRSRLRNVLVAGQVAVSLALLVVAGLFVRSAHNAERSDMGFDPHNVLNLTMETRSIGLDQARSRQLFRDLKDRLRALPGVQSVTVASAVPMGYSGSGSRIYVEGCNNSDKQPAPAAYYFCVDPDYFATMKMPLLRGRGFT